MDDEPSCLASVGNFLRRMGARTRHYMHRIFRTEQSASFEIAVLEPMMFGPALGPGSTVAHGSQPPTDGERQQLLADWRPPTPPALPTPPFTNHGARKRLRMTPMPTCDLDTLTELRHALDDMQQKVQDDEKEMEAVEKDISNPTRITFDEDIEPNDKDIVEQKDSQLQ